MLNLYLQRGFFLIIRGAVAVSVDILSMHVFIPLSAGCYARSISQNKPGRAPGTSNPLLLFLPIQVTPWFYFIGVTFSTRDSYLIHPFPPLRASQSLIITLVSKPKVSTTITGSLMTDLNKRPGGNLMEREVVMLWEQREGFMGRNTA